MRIYYELWPSRPRIWLRNNQTIIDRCNNASGWKSLYTSNIKAYAQNAPSASTIAQDTNLLHCDLMALIIAGLVENSSTYRSKAAEAAYLAATTYYSLYTGTAPRRIFIIGLSSVYDMLYSYLTTTQRNAIRDAIIQRCRDVTRFYSGHTHLNESEKIDGHDPGYAAIAILGCLATFGEHADVQVIFEECMNFWYGATAGDETGTIYYCRWACSQGADQKGGWYSLLRAWFYANMFTSLYNGLKRNSDEQNSLLLDGEPYDFLADESWLHEYAQWLFWDIRGDCNYWNNGDTYRASDNPFHYNIHAIMSFCAGIPGSQYRKLARWIWQLMVTRWGAGGVTMAFDPLLFDIADPNCALEDINAIYPHHVKNFYPPGLVVGHWPDMDPRQSVSLFIHGEERYWHGHNDLCVGGIMATVKDDVVLPHTGIYDEFQSTHRNYWGHQSIAVSGTPLIRPTGQYDDDKFYTAGDAASGYQRIAVATGLGGQPWMTSDGTINGQYGPSNPYQMLHDGNGLLWKKTDYRSFSYNIYSDFRVASFCLDMRRAYLKCAYDYETTKERVRRCDLKMFIILFPQQYPVIFRVVRVESRLSTQTKRDHWHSYTHFAQLGPGAWRSWGYLNKGWVYINYYNPEQYTTQIVGDGPVSGGYGSADFMYDNTNYKPNRAANQFEMPDVGKYRLEIIPVSAANEHQFVNLLCFGTQDQQTIPQFEWLDLVDFFGVRFFGKYVFKISKTTWQMAVAVEGEDVTPPAIPQNLSAQPGDDIATVRLTWTPNADDTISYDIQYREIT